MPWTLLDEEKRLCNEWLVEPLINPETGYPIERNGPTFMSWKERCKKCGISGKPVATKKITWRKCQEWRNNKSVNPDTGRKIKINGPTYKWLEKTCKNMEEKSIILMGEYTYLPDNKGIVPCVINRDTKYIVRTCDNRKIWGPLNKPGKNIKLCYYKDTWDYKYNFFKPIFIGEQPSPIKVNNTYNTQIPKMVKDNPKKIVDKLINLFTKY